MPAHSNVASLVLPHQWDGGQGERVLASTGKDDLEDIVGYLSAYFLYPFSGPTFSS